MSTNLLNRPPFLILNLQRLSFSSVSSGYLFVCTLCLWKFCKFMCLRHFKQATVQLNRTAACEVAPVFVGRRFSPRPWDPSAPPPATVPQGAAAHYLFSITRPFSSRVQLSTFSSFIFNSAWLSRWSICISLGTCPLSKPPLPLVLPYLSRSEWLFPTSPHQTDGASPGPWSWCCSLGGTRWAPTLVGCQPTTASDGRWTKKYQIHNHVVVYLQELISQVA